MVSTRLPAAWLLLVGIIWLLIAVWVMLVMSGISTPAVAVWLLFVMHLARPPPSLSSSVPSSCLFVGIAELEDCSHSSLVYGSRGSSDQTCGRESRRATLSPRCTTIGYQLCWLLSGLLADLAVIMMWRRHHLTNRSSEPPPAARPHFR